MGWDYAISWLTILPFELIAASITIDYWRSDISMAVWVTVFLVVLCIIQIFGVRGYGEGSLSHTPPLPQTHMIKLLTPPLPRPQSSSSSP